MGVIALDTTSNYMLYCCKSYKDIKMNKLMSVFTILGFFVLLTLSGCASKAAQGKSDAYYDRANKASSKAQDRLDRE